MRIPHIAEFLFDPKKKSRVFTIYWYDKNILYNPIAVAPDNVTPGFLTSDLTFEYTKEDEEEEEILPLISKELIFYCKNGNPMPTIKLYLGK
jgi:hypothetical protein